MPLTYAQNKKHIYKWRETHKDIHKTKQKLYQRKYDSWTRIKKEFLKILIDEYFFLNFKSIGFFIFFLKYR